MTCRNCPRWEILPKGGLALDLLTRALQLTIGESCARKNYVTQRLGNIPRTLPEEQSLPPISTFNVFSCFQIIGQEHKVLQKDLTVPFSGPLSFQKGVMCPLGTACFTEATTVFFQSNFLYFSLGLSLSLSVPCYWVTAFIVVIQFVSNLHFIFLLFDFLHSHLQNIPSFILHSSFIPASLFFSSLISVSPVFLSIYLVYQCIYCIKSVLSFLLLFLLLVISFPCVFQCFNICSLVSLFLIYLYWFSCFLCSVFRFNFFFLLIMSFSLYLFPLLFHSWFLNLCPFFFLPSPSVPSWLSPFQLLAVPQLMSWATISNPVEVEVIPPPTSNSYFSASTPTPTTSQLYSVNYQLCWRHIKSTL